MKLQLRRPVQLLQQEGFSLVELVVVVALVMILSSMSINTYDLIKKKAFNAITADAARSAQIAMEGGRIDVPLNTMEMLGTWTDAGGPVRSWGGENFMPGYVNPDDTQLNAWRSGWCENSPGMACAVEGGSVRHCKGNKRVLWWRWNDGFSFQMSMDIDTPC